MLREHLLLKEKIIMWCHLMLSFWESCLEQQIKDGSHLLYQTFSDVCRGRQCVILLIGLKSLLVPEMNGYYGMPCEIIFPFCDGVKLDGLITFHCSWFLSLLYSVSFHLLGLVCLLSTLTPIILKNERCGVLCEDMRRTNLIWAWIIWFYSR